MTSYTPPPLPSQPGYQSNNSFAGRGDVIALLSLILGAVSLVLAIIPGVSLVAFLPAVAAVVLGILAIVLKKPGRTQGIIGLSLGAASVLVGLIVSMSFIGSSLNGTDTAAPIATQTADTSDSSFIDESQTLTQPDPNSGDQVTYDVQVPSGFEDAGTGVAYRFIDENCAMWDYCVVLELFAYTDCPQGVDVEGNEIDYDTDTIYDATYESTGAMYAGDSAVVELAILNPRANGVQLTDIICYY